MCVCVHAYAPCHANVRLQEWARLCVYTVFMHTCLYACLHLHSQNHTKVWGESVFFKGRSCCIWETTFHSYTCTQIYGDNRCYLEPAKCSPALLKQKIKWKHNKPPFFSLFKANKYPHFLKPLKSVTKNIGNIKRFQKNDMNDSMAAQHQYQHKGSCLQEGWQRRLTSLKLVVLSLHFPDQKSELRL